ncbi:S-methyl-5-thioribose-1-phosphate isomerase [Candidatus Mycalebacterium sp.]
MSFKTIEWKNGAAVILDQRKLPGEKTYFECKTHEQVAEAIRSMAIRGAPAIGIAAAMGYALGAAENRSETKSGFVKKMARVRETLAQTRPTAVNLFWALERMGKLLSANPESEPGEIAEILRAEAIAICDEDLNLCKKIGKTGEPLIKNGATVMTHCNAGGLATAGYGTALGVLRAARDAGKEISVISSETRPLLQGARLTAWELSDDGIPVQIITDTAAGYVMKNGGVDAVIVGADRIASNGDVANKIGTYQLSVLAKHHKIAFYVAAPWSTVDMNCASGKDIPIEQRPEREVSHIGQTRTAAQGAKIINPAFDITPAENIDCIITDRGIVKPPCRENMEKLQPTFSISS